MIDVKKVVANLLKNGAKQVNNAVVKSVSVIDKENYKLVVLKLNNEIPMMVRKEINGEDVYERGIGNTLFVSAFSINAILANNPQTAAARKIIMEDDSLLEDFLTYATVDVLQEPVYAGTDSDGNRLTYVNPFSENGEPREIEHDSYYTHIINIELGDDGYEILDGIAEARKEIIKERAKERFAKRSTNGSRGRTLRPANTRTRAEVVQDELEPENQDENENSESDAA